MAATGRLQEPFGQVLRQHRMAAGLSQEALAHAAEVHPTYISMLERGSNSPTLTIIEALAEALGCQPHELVKAAEELVT